MRALSTSGALVLLVSCAGQAPLVAFPGHPETSSGALPARTTRAPEPSLPLEPVTPSAAAPAQPEPPPIALGDIGAAGPIQLLAASNSGAWVALCDGDGKTAKLVVGSGSGEAIDEVLAKDPSGRYVVVSEGGSARLSDTLTHTSVDLSALGADVRRVRADYAEHRTLSFDASGRYLAYLGKRAGEVRIVLRELETGTERAFAPGAGEVFRLKLSADARYVTFEALREDTNRNGKLDWPAPEEPTHKNACEGSRLPKFRSFAFQGRGDATTHAVISLETAEVRDVPELVTPLGASLLVREDDASLRLDRNGKRTPFAPASCAGRVLFADAERGLVVATCAPPPPKKSRGALPAAPHATTGKRELWLFGSGYAKSLQSELYETTTDRDAVVGARLVPLYPGSDTRILDLDSRELVPLAAGSRVLTTAGAQALVWREADLYRYDVSTKIEARLAHGVLKNPDLLSAGNSVLLSPFVVVACNGPAFPSPPRALALSANGFVLTASPARAQEPLGAIQGPLHWVDARLPPPDGPPR